MRFTPTELPEVIVIDPDVHRDGRGFFIETYRADTYAAGGITAAFVQDNHSRSVQNTVRGLHLQVRKPQGKLIRVVEGEIFDVAIDVRRGSPTFGRWVSVRLSAENIRQCYVPVGFAHGFCVLTPFAQVEYKATDVYDPEGEVGIAWNDPALGIEWPVADAILSERDRRHPTLADVSSRLPHYLPKLYSRRQTRQPPRSGFSENWGFPRETTGYAHCSLPGIAGLFTAGRREFAGGARSVDRGASQSRGAPLFFVRLRSSACPEWISMPTWGRAAREALEETTPG